MKIRWLVVVVVLVALGGVFAGNSLGSGRVTINTFSGPENIPAAAAAPAEVVSAPVGMVGVLQAMGTNGMTIQTVEGMQVLTVNGEQATDLLKVGDKVAVWGKKVGDRVVVTKIVVVPEQPGRMHYVGLITDIAADKIDVVGQQGETTSFRLDSTLQKVPVDHTLVIGDTVTVVAKPDPLGDGWLAIAIVK